MKNKQHTIFILVLGALTAVGPFSIDMYLPGFPSIAEELHTDIAHVEYSLTSYFIGISLGQLVYGPLLDRFGRKKPLTIGLLLYIVAALSCGLSPSIGWLIAQRFFLALGGCVGMVASRAIVRDLFPVNEIARIFSTLMLVIGISPILAPTVGGWIAATIGWRFIFGILALIAGAVVIAVVRLLPESKPPDPTVSLHPRSIVREYVAVMKDPTFITYALASGAGSAGLFAYIADSPFLFMRMFGLSESAFGITFAVNAGGLIFASQLNRLWLNKAPSQRIAFTAAIVQLITALLLLAATVGTPSFGIVIVLLFGFLFWLGFLNPNTTAVALSPFTRYVGSASALLGSIQMVGGACASGVISYLHNGTAIPMASVMAGCAAVSVGLQTGRRIVLKRAAANTTALDG